MAAKKPKHRRSNNGKLAASMVERPKNSARAEVATVAWMLALLATLLAEVLGVLIRSASVWIGDSDRLQVLSSTLLLTALVAGSLTLVLTPVTLKMRQIAPPMPVVVSAIVVGSIPLLTVILLALRP